MPSSRRYFRSALLSTGALLAGTAIVLPGAAQAATATHTAPTAATSPSTRVAPAPDGFTPALTPYDEAGDQFGTTSRTVTWTSPGGPYDYQCALDGEAGRAYTPCNVSFAMSDLAIGSHTLYIERRDTGGGATWIPVNEIEFFVQPTAPVVDGSTPDPEAPATQNPRVAFAPQPGSTLQCRSRYDGGDWASCANPFGAGLSSDRHDYDFRWIDNASGVWSGTTSVTLNVDNEAPEAPGVFERPDDGPSTSVRIGVNVYSDAKVECRIDDAEAFTECSDNGYIELTGLAQGAHKVEVRQTDQAGNVSETTVVEFTVLAPHAPTIVEGPSGTVDTTFAQFRLAYDDPEWFVGDLMCSLDGAEFDHCGDFNVYLRELSQGEHVFRTRQTVDGTNHSPVSERRWVVNGFVSDEPTGPQFGNAPEDTPAPAPKPVPTPAPTPTPTPTPELKAPSTPLAGKSAAVVGRALTVGCTVPGATSYRCEVTVSKGGKTLGRAVRTGNGSVQLKLTRAGARQVQRSGKGLTVRVQVTATVGGKSTVTTKTVRLLPTKDLALSTDEFFGAKGDTPTAAGKRIAKDIAAQLSGARRITITGHTDNAGSPAANQRLGLQRAEAVAALLRKAGLGGARVVVRSEGESKPKASNGTAKGREQNRRVEIVVSY